MRKPRNKSGGTWKFIPDSSLSPEEQEAKAREEVSEQLGAILSFSNTDFASRCAAVEEFTNYFPGSNEVPEGGAWVLVKEPPHCEYTVPPLSIWFAEPWDMQNERHNSHRVKIVTPRGNLGLFPREYSRIEDPSKYFEFVGNGMTIKFFGNTEGVPKDALFYLRSRGIKKQDAITMLIGQIKAHGVCWIESDKKVCSAFGKKWPDESRLATIQNQ